MYVMEYSGMNRQIDEKELDRLLEEWEIPHKAEVVKRINSGEPYKTAYTTIRLAN